MLKWGLAGKSNIWIKSQLDAKGVLARRGGLFSEGSINALMKNTHYIGYYNWTDKKSAESVLWQCPAFIDETVWNDVQEKRKKNFCPQRTEQSHQEVLSTSQPNVLW